MKQKKLASFALAFAMGLAVLPLGFVSADSETEVGKKGQLQEKGNFPISSEGETVSIATVQTSYFGDVPNIYFTKWYEEQSGVKVDWRIIPEATKTEQIGIMMASLDTLPDAMMGMDFSPADQVKYGSQGIFIDLKNYINDLGVFTKEAYTEKMLQSITAPDGAIYALPGVNACYHCMFPGKAMINQKWLDNLGLKMPTTTEEFHEVLKAFKEQDANGNGDPNDEVPMMGSDGGWNARVYDFLLEPFFYNDYTSRISLEDGKVKFNANTEEFKEALKYIRSLVEEELIDPVSLTQTAEEFAQVGGAPDEVLVGVVTGATWWTGLGPDSSDPLQRSREYVALPPLKGPNGEQNTLTATSPLATGKFVITNKAQNPELLFKWADGLMSDEATYISTYGKIEEGWLAPDEGAKGINGKPALYKIPEAGGGAADDSLLGGMPNVALANRTSDFRLGQQLKDSEDSKWDSEPRLYQITHDAYEPFNSDSKSVPTLMMEPEESTERASLETQIVKYVNEQIVAFLSGNRDIDAEWDAYVAEFNNLGLDRYIELLQKAYTRQYGEGGSTEETTEASESESESETASESQSE